VAYGRWLGGADSKMSRGREGRGGGEVSLREAVALLWFQERGAVSWLSLLEAGK